MGVSAVFLLVFFTPTLIFTSAIKCNVSVDITNGVKEGTSIIFDGITYDKNNYYTDGNEIRGCVCNVKKCVRKCCIQGEILNITSKSCESITNSAISIDTFHIINVPDNEICHEGDYRVKLEENFTLSNGTLIWDDNQYLDEYCVDSVENSRVAIICVADETEVNRIIMSIGMIISMPFLLATFLVYLILPESNLHRKALMNYVMTLLLAYIFLVTVQLHTQSIEPKICSTLGYTILLLFLVSFFWMNVMCVDMWFAFSGMRGFNGRRIAERKRFLMYSAYAYGVPILHILIVFIIDRYGDQDANYYPGVGTAKCFLNDGVPNLLYFYGPIALLIAINIVLFILTSVKIQKVKKETSMLKQSDSRRHSYEDDKQKFNLYVKLMFAMGINWVMEIISWAVQWKMENSSPYYMWYLTDFCNATYGVFIFFIFAFKKKIWHSLKRRYYGFIGKPYLAHTMSVTQTTRSSNYSTTETGLSDHRMSELKNARGEERILARH